MEEFKKLCVNANNAISMAEFIDTLTFTNDKSVEFTGKGCFQPMADNIQALNSSGK